MGVAQHRHVFPVQFRINRLLEVLLLACFGDQTPLLSELRGSVEHGAKDGGEEMRQGAFKEVRAGGRMAANQASAIQKSEIRTAPSATFGGEIKERWGYRMGSSLSENGLPHH